MRRFAVLRVSVFLLLFSTPAIGTAQQPEHSVAAVTSWRSNATRIKVYNRDGTPQGGGRMANLSDVDPSGLREWDRDFDLIKVTAAPERWIQASDLNLTFCEHVARPALVDRGSGSNNKGITMGSGASCP